MAERKNIFESMKYLSNMDFSGFTKMVEQQEKFMNNFNGIMDQSTNFGKDVEQVLERNHEQYQKLTELWTDFSDVSEEMVEENMDEELPKEFQEYREKIEKKLNELVETSHEDAEELYSAWTRMSDSMFQGLKAGTGPNPSDVFEALADFHQTALHTATKNIEENRESMKELQNLLDDLGEKLNDKMKENVETTSERYEDFIEDWFKSVNKMEETVEEQMEKTEKNYLNTLEPYFGERSVMPLFPWIPKRRMREYEGDIEELKEKIEELEKKVEEG